MIDPVDGGRRSSSVDRMGAMTTNRPVTNPAFEARVYCKPMVCAV